MISFLNKTLNRELIKNHTRTVILIWFLLAFVPATFIMFMEDCCTKGDLS